MTKDIAPILIIALIFLGLYYVLTIEDPRKVQQVVLAFVPAILVYYMVVKRPGRNSSRKAGGGRTLAEDTTRD